MGKGEGGGYNPIPKIYQRNWSTLCQSVGPIRSAQFKQQKWRELFQAAKGGTKGGRAEEGTEEDEEEMMGNWEKPDRRNNEMKPPSNLEYSKSKTCGGTSSSKWGFPRFPSPFVVDHIP
jgi:hypothetical protein